MIYNLSKPVRPFELSSSIRYAMEYSSKTEKKVESFPTLEFAEFRKKKLLVVEDNIINQKIAQIMLEKIGFIVDVVANGHEAVESIKIIEYDLILMDCQMPVMDGFDATKAIRKLEKQQIIKSKKAITIIAMTANVMKGDEEKCIECGMDDYLSKPINPNELHSSLVKWLL
jgi:CheY-like chemotaxis protein